MSRTLIQDSVNVYDGNYLATIFVLTYFWQPLLCDRKAECREIEYSRASEQKTLWERVFCPLFGGCPYLGGLPLFDYSIFNDTRYAYNNT